MDPQSRWRLFSVSALALVLFAAVIGAAQGLVALNARTSPGIPWFPIPVLGLVAVVIVLLKRRFDLRLTHQRAVPWARAYAFTLLATAAAMGLSIVEAAFNGLTRAAPAWPGNDSALFQLAFLLTLPLVASIMAEVSFRGLLQTVWERHLPIAIVLVGIAVINGLMHFYDADQMSQWLRFVSLNLVWGYITWRSDSLLPALTAHTLMNIVEPVTELIAGPTEMSALGLPLLSAITIGSVLLLLAALWQLRGWHRP